jgi:hypothetical protein
MLAAVAIGVVVWQKSRPRVQQDMVKMDHVHFHVLPSVPGETLYEQTLSWRRELFTPLDPLERDQIALLRPTQVDS